MYRYKIGVSVCISNSFFKQVKKMDAYKKSEMVYQGCFKRNIDGTNRLIKKGDVGSRPTNIPFWMSTEDVINGVKTRSQERNQKDVKKVDFDEYFIKKNIDEQLQKSFETEIEIILE